MTDHCTAISSVDQDGYVKVVVNKLYGKRYEISQNQS